MKFKAPIEVQAGISDGDPTNPLGQSGYLLSSDGSNVNWVSPGGLSAATAETIVQPIKANGALSKGDPLYIVGYQTGQNVNIVAKADSSDVAKMPVVGLADDDYANQAFGTMTAFGSFNGDFDTTGGTESWAIGDIIFVKPGGGLTNIKPGGTDLIQNVAIVSRVNSQTGELEVIALGRTNDVPNLPTGRLFVGTATNTSLVSDVVYVDEPNNRVGIGTTSPAAKLHVEGNVLIDAYNQGEDNGLFFREGFLTIDQPSITVWDMTNGGASPDGLSINSFDGIRFRENGGEVARFKDGNFGIGTTSPGAKLDVNGGIRLGQYNAIQWGSNTSNQLSIQNLLSGSIITQLGSGDLELNSASNGIVFKAGGATKAKLLSSGNFGIGDTDPGARLVVAQPQITSGGFSTPFIELKSTAQTNNTGLVAMSFSTSTADNYGYSIGALRGSSGGASSFVISHHDNSLTGTERIRIDSSGNVGIGTTDPAELLTVSASDDVSIRINSTKNGTWTTNQKLGALEFFGNDSSSNGAGLKGYINLTSVNTFGAAFNMNFGVGNNATDRMVIKYNGNVGIGTTDPTRLLHIASQLSLIHI